jgi:hypothetical protein
MDEGVIAIIMFFSFLGAIILVPVLAKERTRRSAHDLISQAMARGQTLEPALIAKLSEDIMNEGNRARKSLGNGVILLALAGGFLASGYVIDSTWGHGGDSDVVHGMLVPAVLLGTVGAAFLLLAIFDYATKKRE